MAVRYSTHPVVSEQSPGSEYAVVAGSHYDDEPAVWCRILTPGRNRDYRAVIVEPGDRLGKMVFVAATAGPDRLKRLIGHLVLVDLERERTACVSARQPSWLWPPSATAAASRPFGKGLCRNKL